MIWIWFDQCHQKSLLKCYRGGTEEFVLFVEWWMRNQMKQCVKWVKEGFLEEAGVILELTLKDA